MYVNITYSIHLNESKSFLVLLQACMVLNHSKPSKWTFVNSPKMILMVLYEDEYDFTPPPPTTTTATTVQKE